MKRVEMGVADEWMCSPKLDVSRRPNGGQTEGDSPELDVPEDVADAVLDLRLRRERGRGGEERERAAVRYTPPCECIVTQSRSCYHPKGPSKRRVVPEVVGVTY